MSKYIYHVLYWVDGAGLSRAVSTLSHMIDSNETIKQLEEDYSKLTGKKSMMLTFTLLNLED